MVNLFLTCQLVLIILLLTFPISVVKRKQRSLILYFDQVLLMRLVQSLENLTNKIKCDIHAALPDSFLCHAGK
jgi:hypothetical protein